jgi:hypothetical protein
MVEYTVFVRHVLLSRILCITKINNDDIGKTRDSSVRNIEHDVLAAQISMHQWWVETVEVLKRFAELQVNVPDQDFGDDIEAEGG